MLVLWRRRARPRRISEYSLILLLALPAAPTNAQDDVTPPPPPRVRPRDLPENQLTTSLEFQELRMMPRRTPSDSPKIKGLKGADLEDLKASEKVLAEMSKAWQAMKQEKRTKALAHFKKATELDPNYSKAWNNLGLLYQALGKPADAEGALRKAIEVNPSNATAWKNLGFFCLSHGRFAEAITPLTTAVQLSPEDGYAAAFLGEAMFQMGRMAEAAALLERAKILAPGYSPITYRLGCVYAKQQRYPEALALLNQVLRSEKPGVDVDSVRKLVSELQQLER